MIDKTKERFGLKPRVPGRRQRLRIDFKPLANGSSGDAPGKSAPGATSTYSVVNRNVCYRAAAKITATAEMGAKQTCRVIRSGGSRSRR